MSIGIAQTQVTNPAPASTGGAGNFVQVQVDFGFASGNEGDSATATVTGQTWVTASSIIECVAAGKATADHDPDDVWAERIVAYATNLVAGTGFDVVATSANEGGRTWGKYYINCTGA